MKRLRVALIGSGLLHKEQGHESDIEYLHKLCYRLAELGVQFTSGLSETGLNAIAQIEFSRALDHHRIVPSQFEIYAQNITAIRKSKLPNKNLALTINSSVKHQSHMIAKSLHSNWDGLTRYAQARHAANVHLILGYHLNSQVDAVITWCVTDNNGVPIGETSTAIRLAYQYNIPVFNFYGADRKKTIDKIYRFLKKNKWKLQGLK